MVTMQEVMNQLAGKGVVDEFVSFLEQNLEDFSDVHSRYICALEKLRNDLGENPHLSVEDLIAAIEKQTSSNLLFSGVLGVKSNLDHFIDPMAKTVMEMEFHAFLREDMACRLPEYEKAQNTIDRFYLTLSSGQKEVFEDITEYISYLETTGPKIAHFCGHILGDEILYRIVPGYYPDRVLTMQYRSMLGQYFGKVIY